MIERITLVVRETILHTPLLKADGCSFNDLSQVKKIMVVLLNQFPHAMTSVECAGQQDSHQIIVVGAYTASDIGKGLQMSEAKGQLPFHRVSPYFLCTSNHCFHKRV
jgi:hypothetical protein